MSTVVALVRQGRCLIAELHRVRPRCSRLAFRTAHRHLGPQFLQPLISRLLPARFKAPCARRGERAFLGNVLISVEWRDHHLPQGRIEPKIASAQMRAVVVAPIRDRIRRMVLDLDAASRTAPRHLARSRLRAWHPACLAQNRLRCSSCSLDRVDNTLAIETQSFDLQPYTGKPFIAVVGLLRAHGGERSLGLWAMLSN